MNRRIRYLESAFLVWSALLLLATASGHLHSPDGEVNYRTARSLATGGGFAIDPLPDGSLTRTGQDGKEYSQYGVLLPLLAVPLYWLGNSLSGVIPDTWLSAQSKRLNTTVQFYRPSQARWGESFDGLYPTGPRERVRRTVVSHFNSLVTWATVLLLVFLSRRLFGDSLARMALPVTYLVATWAWPHTRDLYTEPLALLFILAALYSSLFLNAPGSDPRGNLLSAAIVGICAGLAVLARLDSVVALPGILWVACGRIARGGGSPSIGALVAIGTLAFLLITAVLPLQNYLRFGSPFATGYSDQPEGVAFSIPFLHSLYVYFLSPGKGIFGYSPPLLAALLVWPAFFQKNRLLAAGILLILLGYVLVVARWQNLGGWCWGPRHLFQINALLLLPLPYLFQCAKESPLRKIGLPVFAITLALGVFVQVCGILVDFMWPLDRLMRTPDPLSDADRVLSAAYYGPVLHLKTWRMDRIPDWFLADLWRSGEIGARFFAGSVWSFFVALSVLLSFGFLRNLKAR